MTRLDRSLGDSTWSCCCASCGATLPSYTFCKAIASVLPSDLRQCCLFPLHVSPSPSLRLCLFVRSFCHCHCLARRVRECESVREMEEEGGRAHANENTLGQPQRQCEATHTKAKPQTVLPSNGPPPLGEVPLSLNPCSGTASCSLSSVSVALL